VSSVANIFIVPPPVCHDSTDICTDLQVIQLASPISIEIIGDNRSFQILEALSLSSYHFIMAVVERIENSNRARDSLFIVYVCCVCYDPDSGFVGAFDIGAGL
jgi:hypothetical protein